MRLKHNEKIVIDVGHTGYQVTLSWEGRSLQVSILDENGVDVDDRGQGLNLAPVPAPPSAKTELEQNAEKLAKLLDYVGHGGYEEKATSSGERVNITCAHCGSADHLELICHSLNPLRVTIGPDGFVIEEFEIEEFESVDALRENLEDTMGGY